MDEEFMELSKVKLSFGSCFFGGNVPIIHGDFYHTYLSSISRVRCSENKRACDTNSRVSHMLLSLQDE